MHAAALTKRVSRQSIATKLESERLMVSLLDNVEGPSFSRDKCNAEAIPRLCRPARRHNGLVCCSENRGDEVFFARSQVARQDPAGFGIASRDRPGITDVANAEDDLLELLDRFVVRGLEGHGEHRGVEVRERLCWRSSQIGAQTRLKIHQHVESTAHRDSTSTNVLFFNTLNRAIEESDRAVVERDHELDARRAHQRLLLV
jgi:hypothetical protein